MPFYALADKSPGTRRSPGQCYRTLTAVVAALVALAPVAACAHAIVVAASPAVNARIAPGTLHIRLQLNSRIDVDRSRLTLHGPAGTEHPVVLMRNEAAGVLAGDALVAAAGPWKLHWEVLSVDGHITRGEIAFSVDQGKTTP
ncbi:MAG TPA: copper resistance CopC family protein [Casimicrobiaceae bacterium]